MAEVNKLKLPLIILVIVIMVTPTILATDYLDCNVFGNCVTTIGTTSSSSTSSGNTTNFTNYWTTNTDQAGLTGNKTGSFIINTTGTISSGDIALQDVGGNPSIRINNYYDGANDRRTNDGAAFQISRVAGVFRIRYASYGLAGTNIASFNEVFTINPALEQLFTNIDSVFDEEVTMAKTLNVSGLVNIFNNLNVTQNTIVHGNINVTQGIINTGTVSSITIAKNTYEGSVFFYDPYKTAIRAEFSRGGTSFNDANIGNESAGFGHEVLVVGNKSFGAGDSVTCGTQTNQNAICLGTAINNQASNSVAIGDVITGLSTKSYQYGFGYGITNSEDYNFAFGQCANTHASSVCLGMNVLSPKVHLQAMGDNIMMSEFDTYIYKNTTFGRDIIFNNTEGSDSYIYKEVWGTKYQIMNISNSSVNELLGNWTYNKVPLGMDYTNIALTNITNYFSKYQVINGTSMDSFYVDCDDANPDCSGTYYYAGTNDGFPYYNRSDDAYVIWKDEDYAVYVVSISVGDIDNAWYESAGSISGFYNNLVGTYTGDFYVVISPLMIRNGAKTLVDLGAGGNVNAWFGGVPPYDIMFYMKEDRESNGLFYLEGQDGGVLRVDTFAGNTNLDNYNQAGGDFYIGRDMVNGYVWLGTSGGGFGIKIPVGTISTNSITFLNNISMGNNNINVRNINTSGNINVTKNFIGSIVNVTGQLNVKGTTNLTGYVTASNISLTGIQGNVTFTNNVTFADTYYEDLNFPVANTKINPATSKPDEDIQNVYYLFDDATIETIRGSGQTSHTQKMGTPLYCHIHWIQTTTNGNVSWQLNYTLMALNSTNSTWLILNSSINPVYNRTVGVNQISEFPVTEPIRTLSTIFRFKVSRIGNGVNDTLVGKAPFQSFDCHYEIDSPGSRMEYLK